MEKIKKGDKFLCINDVEMYDNNTYNITYEFGKIYYSDLDDCITDKEHDVYHKWTWEDDFENYFMKIKYKN
jgi:hypothetical protein